MNDEPSTFAPPPPSQRTRARRHRYATVVLPQLRHAEMQQISDRLGRCTTLPLVNIWITAATLTGGALIGGGLALIPFLAVHPQPTYAWRLIYFVVLGVLAVVTVLAVAAAWTTHRARAESIRDIKRDFDKYILHTFELPVGESDSTGGEAGGELSENG